MKHSLEKNVCISSSRMTASDSVSLPRLDTDGCMSDTPETMGGLSGVPNGTSSQTIYNRATRTRRHLLLKIGQMPTQTAASRGYVLFRGAIRDTHKSPTNCLPECGHAPSECSKLGKTRIIADAATGWLEMPHFLNRMFPRHSTRNRNGMLLIILLISSNRTIC